MAEPTDPTMWGVVGAVAGAAITGLGMILVGWFKYLGVQRQSKVEADIALPETQRKLIEALMARVGHLEEAAEDMRRGYRLTIKEHREEIDVLRARVVYLENKLRETGVTFE